MTSPQSRQANRGLYLVFSRPDEQVPADEFNAWYERHVLEILQTPGFEAAQRYRISAVNHGALGQQPYTYLVLWETTSGIDELRAALRQREEAGDFVLPEWFSKTLYMTWDCQPLGPRHARDDVGGIS